MLFQLCSNYVPTVFQLCSNCVPIMFQLCSNCVPIMFQLCSNCVPIMFKLCSNILFQLCSNYVPILFQYFVPIMFQFYSNILFQLCSNFILFQLCSNCVPTVFQPHCGLTWYNNFMIKVKVFIPILSILSHGKEECYQVGDGIWNHQRLPRFLQPTRGAFCSVSGQCSLQDCEGGGAQRGPGG